MLFVVIEDSRGHDPKAIHRRSREKGRMMPDGLRFVGGWVTADMGRCFRLMEADEVAPLQRRVAGWCDPAGFEIVPVAPGTDTAEALNDRL